MQNGILHGLGAHCTAVKAGYCQKKRADLQSAMCTTAAIEARSLDGPVEDG